MQDRQIRPPSLDVRTIFRRVGRNIGVLLGSTGIVLLIGVVQVGLNARALGPEGLGVVTLVQSYALLLGNLFTFESWQPLIRFGAEAIAADDRKRLRDLVVLAGLFDVAGSTMAGMAAIIVLLLIGPELNISEASLGLALVFSFTLFFRIAGSTTGILRLFDKFSVVAWVNVSNALLGLAAMIALYLFNASLFQYVIVLAILNVVASVALIVASLRVYRAHGLPPLLTTKFYTLRPLIPAFSRFSLATFPQSSLNALKLQLDVFLLGWLLGASAVGLYAIAQRVSSAATRLTAPVEQVSYPEIAVLVTDKAYDRLRHILLRFFGFGLIAALGFVVAILLLGPLVVFLVAGKEFAEAVVPLNWLVIALAITCAGFWIRPATVCLVGPRQYLTTSVIATSAAVVTAPLAIQTLGIAGAGLSQIAFAVIWFGLNVFAVAKRLHSNLKNSAD